MEAVLKKKKTFKKRGKEAKEEEEEGEEEESRAEQSRAGARSRLAGTRSHDHRRGGREISAATVTSHPRLRDDKGG